MGASSTLIYVNKTTDIHRLKIIIIVRIVIIKCLFLTNTDKTY